MLTSLWWVSVSTSGITGHVMMITVHWSRPYLSLSCHLTGLTTDGWWPLPWTVGEQLPGVSSCRIGSEWQCGNTGNTGNPWQGQTKSWEAARAQGPAPAMGSLRLCCPRSPHSEAGPRPHSASAHSVQARAASSMWPGARGLLWQSALSCSVLMSHVTMRLPDHCLATIMIVSSLMPVLLGIWCLFPSSWAPIPDWRNSVKPLRGWVAEWLYNWNIFSRKNEFQERKLDTLHWNMIHEIHPIFWTLHLTIWDSLQTSLKNGEAI